MNNKPSKYKWEATTLEGFVQQLAVGYVARRYYFYVTGSVPKRLDATEHDRRMLAKFDVARSKWSRYRRRQRTGPDGRPLANVHYLRYRNFWVLIATAGHHPFFLEHTCQDAPSYRDIRETPIRFGGYSISHRGKTSVRISRRAYRVLKQHFLAMATHHYSSEPLEQEFRRSPFEPYGGVTRQMFAVHRAVNRARKTAGLRPVPSDCIRTRRRAVKPFEPPVYQLAA